MGVDLDQAHTLAVALDGLVARLADHATRLRDLAQEAASQADATLEEIEAAEWRAEQAEPAAGPTSDEAGVAHEADRDTLEQLVRRVVREVVREELDRQGR